MSSKEKRGIAILIAITIIVIITVMVSGKKEEINEEPRNETQQTEQEEKYTTELEDGTKINTSEEFNSSKRYNNLEISNIQYTEKNGMTVMLADVKNVGTTKHEKEIVRIEIIGDNGEIITELKPVIGEIEVGETIKLNASVTADVANAKDFRITAVK